MVRQAIKGEVLQKKKDEYEYDYYYYDKTASPTDFDSPSVIVEDDYVNETASDDSNPYEDDEDIDGQEIDYPDDSDEENLSSDDDNIKYRREAYDEEYGDEGESDGFESYNDRYTFRGGDDDDF